MRDRTGENLDLGLTLFYYTLRNVGFNPKGYMEVVDFVTESIGPLSWEEIFKRARDYGYSPDCPVAVGENCWVLISGEYRRVTSNEKSPYGIVGTSGWIIPFNLPLKEVGK